MKKTTYIFIGLFIAGLVVTIGGVCLVRSFLQPYEEVPVGEDEYCTLPLQDRFSTIIINHNTERNVLLTGELNNLVIRECDSVTEPSLKTCKSLRNVFVCDLANDTLRLTVDFSRLADSDSAKKFVRFALDGRNLATIIVPEGMLRNIKDKKSEIEIEDFKTSCLKVDSKGLILKSCVIDTLRCGSSRMNELRLKDTHIQYAYIRQSSGRLDVDSADGSRIGRMEVSGKRDGSACTRDSSLDTSGFNRKAQCTPQQANGADTSRRQVRANKLLKIDISRTGCGPVDENIYKLR